MTPQRHMPEHQAALLPVLANDEMERLALKTLLMGRYEMESAVAALHPDAFYNLDRPPMFEINPNDVFGI